MKLEEQLTEKRILIGSIILTIIILSIIPFVRFLFFNSLLPGTEPYYHIRMAKYIHDQGIPKEDPLIQRPYLLNPYHLLLAGSSSIFGIYLSSILLPFFFGIISVIIFFFILKRFKLILLKKALILFILIISPAFIYTFSTSNPYALSLLILLLGFYFFITPKKILNLLSIPVLGSMAFFNPISILITIFLLLSYSIYNRAKIKKFYTILLILFLISILHHLPFLIQHGLPKKLTFVSQSIFINLISDLGSNIGFGIFHLFLAIIGLYIIWESKKPILSYFLLASSILIGFYFIPMNTYLTFLFSISAGYGFFSLIKMRWKIQTLKILTIMLITYGLLFSSISYINRISNSRPDKETIKSLEWFSARPKGIVLSHYTKGFWIETVANKPVLLDSIAPYTSSLDIKFNDSDEIFYSRNLIQTKSLLDKHNISYIWLDNSMKEEVWTKKEQGLLFLFRNNETFKNLYSSKEVEIWQILRD